MAGVQVSHDLSLQVKEDMFSVLSPGPPGMSGKTGLLQYWQFEMLGLRKDILELKNKLSNMHPHADAYYYEGNDNCVVLVLTDRSFIYWPSQLFRIIERHLNNVEAADNLAATFNPDHDRASMRLGETVLSHRQDWIDRILQRYKIIHPEANTRVLHFFTTVLLVIATNTISDMIAEAACQTISRLGDDARTTSKISQVANYIIKVNANIIPELILRETVISTAGKAEGAVRSIAKGAAIRISLALDTPFSTSSTTSTPDVHPETPPPDRENITPSLKLEDYWIRLCGVALRRYRPSVACLSITAIESFIVHLQDGGDEGGTAPLILKEDYDESPFELGPSSSIRRVLSSGHVVLEWGDGLMATISQKDLVMEAEARGLFGRETSLDMLQATLHDLIIDSTDAITSIQYLDGLHVQASSDQLSWENSKVDFCRRFLSSFTPSGHWDDCTARHALRDKRRPGLHFDFYLQTTLKSIRASLLRCRQARLQWRWSARNSCTFEGDTLIANGYYLDTIVLVGKGIYVAERVTHGTSVVQRDIWKTAPWRPLEPRVSLMALEDELDRLNGELLKLQQSSELHRNLVTSKSVGLPLVAFASAIAAIGSIVAAPGPKQLGLGILGLIAAVAAFILSFIDDAIKWQVGQTARKIADATQARTRYEGDSRDKAWLECV